MKRSSWHVYWLILRVYLFLPYYFALSFFKRPSYPPKRILVLPQLTRIGDFVCTTHVYRAIKQKYPHAEIDVVVSSLIEELVSCNPRLNQVIILENHTNNELIQLLRRRDYDLAISLAGTSFSSVLMLLALIPYRLKLIRANRPLSELASDWLANRRLGYKDHTYLPEFYLKLLQIVDISSAGLSYEVYGSSGSDERARTLLAEREVNLSGQSVLVGMSITAGNKIKEWGDHKFIELAERLIQDRGVQIVFIGSPRDRERIVKCVAALPEGRAFNVAGIPLSDLPAVMKFFSLFIAVDTGPIHMANALSIPLVDITGPVDPSELSPRGKCCYYASPPQSIPYSSFVFKRPGPAKLHAQSLASTKVDEVYAVCQTAVDECVFNRSTKYYD